MKKSIIFLVIVGVLLFSTAVFAESPLVLWQFFGVGSETDTVDTATTEPNTFYAIMRAAIQESGMSVNTVQVDWGQYYTILNQSLASKKAGDIDIMHIQYLLPYAKAGLVANLSNLEKETGIYLDKIIQPQLLESVTYNGDIYAVNWDIHAFLWHINKVEFAKAGLLDKDGNPIIPTTAQEFINAAEKYKEVTGQPFVYSDNGESTPWEFYAWLLQNGGEFLSDDGWKAGFNSKAGVDVLDFMTYLTTHELANFSMTVADESSALLNGKVASIFQGTWMVNQYASTSTPELDLYVTAVPTLYHVGPAKIWANAHSFVIPAYLPLQKQVEAYKFLVAMLKYNSYWGNTGHIPTAQLSQDQLNHFLSLNGEGVRNYYEEVSKEGAILAQPFAGNPWGVILPYLQKAFLGEATPQSALDEAADALNRFISQQ